MIASIGSLEFSKLLLEKAQRGGVARASASASTARAIVRIALVENEHRIRQAARNIKKFLSDADTTLHNVVPLASASGPVTVSGLA